MAKFVVIYKTPKDPDAFDKHYFDVHVPLAKTLPGLRKYEISRGGVACMAGASDTHLVAVLHFDNIDAIKEAFASTIGQATAADRRIFAPDDADVQMFLFEDREY
jgi:uncharacterized protein (TIGR02118 family)